MRPEPSTTNEPERTSSPLPRADGPRLAGQDRLVQPYVVGGGEATVHDELIARRKQDDVAGEHLPGGHRARGAAARRRRPAVTRPRLRGDRSRA
jgi:hypothetical protein